MNKKLLNVFTWIWIVIWILILLYIVYSLVSHYPYKSNDDLYLDATIEWPEDVCNRFKNDCIKRVRSDLWWGGRVVMADDYFKLSKSKCPDDCLRYTEERWYFADENKQKEYFDSKIKECEELIKRLCKKNKDVVEQNFFNSVPCLYYCNEYWEMEVSLD